MPSAYQSRVLADGAQAYWPLDDPSGTTARDLAGAHAGTISGGVTLGVTGIGSATAMTFNGTTGKIVLPTLATANALTIETWARTDNALLDPVFSNRAMVGSGDQVVLGIYQRQALVYDATVGQFGVRVFADASWHYLVGVFTGTTCQFFVDGVSDTTVPFPRATPGTNTANLGYDNASTTYLTGSLQDVAIYPSVLTPTTISQHFTLRTAPESGNTHPWWVYV